MTRDANLAICHAACPGGYGLAVPDSTTGNGGVPVPEETDSPSYADDRNFYKVEKRTRVLDEWPPPQRG